MFVALGLLVVILLIYLYYVHYHPKFEQFANITPSPEEEIIKLYQDLLERQPSPTELQKYLGEMKTGQLTMDGLQQQLLDSDEYQRWMKLQSNELAPELRKMVYEKRTLSYLSRAYSESTGRAISPKFLLPLRDIFIYIEYNDMALRLFLKSPVEEEFEKQLLNAFQLNKETTLELFEKTFPKEDLLKEAKSRTKGQVSSIQDPPPQVLAEGVAKSANQASVNESSLLLTKPASATIEGFTSKIVTPAPAMKEQELHDLYRREEWRSTSPQPVDSGHMFETFVSSIDTFSTSLDAGKMMMDAQEIATKIFNKDEAAKLLQV